MAEKDEKIESVKQAIGEDQSNYWNRPHCSKILPDGTRCKLRAMENSQSCTMHQPVPINRATLKQISKDRMNDLIIPAMDCLEQAMYRADWPQAIKAAGMILDRAGFHAKTAVEVSRVDENEDLTILSHEQLRERALKIANRLAQDGIVADVPRVTSPPAKGVM